MATVIIYLIFLQLQLGDRALKLACAHKWRFWQVGDHEVLWLTCGQETGPGWDGSLGT